MEGITGLMSARAATIGLGLIGMAICSSGVRRVAVSGDWLSLPGVLGILLGVVALAIIGAAIMGRELPGIPGDGAALIILATVIVMKIGIAAVVKF